MTAYNPKIVFFGSSQRAASVLDTLATHGFVPHMIVTTDSPEVENWITVSNKKIQIVLRPEKIDEQTIDTIRAEKPDLGILASYGKILPKALLGIFPKGILNIHPSLLPQYRGPSPEQSAIVHGDHTTGVSIMLLGEGMDAGPILIQKELSIAEHDTLMTLSEKLFALGSNLLAEVLPQWLANTITPVPQDNSKATYTKLLKKSDGTIDWTKKAEEVERMIRAYHPWPGSFAEIQNKKTGGFDILKIKQARVIPFANKTNIASGVYFKTSDGFPGVVCAENALKLEIVQPAGKKDMTGKAYLMGHRELCVFSE